MPDDGYADVMIVSFGLAALVVALGFLVVYTCKWRHRHLIAGCGALALSVVYVVIAFTGQKPHERFQNAMQAAIFFVGGFASLKEYRRKMNSAGEERVSGA